MQTSPALESVEQAPQTTDGQEAVSPEDKQPSPEISPAHEDKGYQTRSGRMSVRPTTFNDYVMYK